MNLIQGVLELIANTFLPGALKPFIPFVIGLLDGLDLPIDDDSVAGEAMEILARIVTRLNDAVEAGTTGGALEVIRQGAQLEAARELRALKARLS